jgi:integrase/recombinase XerD
MNPSFRSYLVNSNLSKNTIDSYTFAVRHYNSIFKSLTKTNLIKYKNFLIDHYKPKTVNLRIQGINKFLVFLKKPEFKINVVKIQQQTYLDNVVSNADYTFLKNQLLKEGNKRWYFVVRFLACTGVRVSELIQFKIEHVLIGYFDIYSKAGKIRRVFIPASLLKEAREWINESSRKTGYLFLNESGTRITTRGIAHQLKHFARRYGMNEKVIYPHSFRHRFAKNFIEKYNDLALLADLLGHESIETTRIYLRRTSNEQRSIVDKIVTW